MAPDVASFALPATPALPPVSASRDRIRATAEEFESVFLSTMLSQMFAGLPTDGPFGGGHAEETYRGMLIEQYGKEIAATGGIGIADEVARELLRLQEAQNDAR
jgi:flagellar protein FlgJ